MLLVSSVAAVILPVAVQGLGQADGEVATGKLPQGTRVPILPGVDQRRLCRRKRRCSALGQHLPHLLQMCLWGTDFLGPHPALCPAPVTFGAEQGRWLKGACATAEDQHRHFHALQDCAPAGASPGEKKDPNPCCRSTFCWQNTILEPGDLGRGSSAEEHMEMESPNKLATPSLLPSPPATPVPEAEPWPGVQGCLGSSSFPGAEPFPSEPSKTASGRALFINIPQLSMAEACFRSS